MFFYNTKRRRQQRIELIGLTSRNGGDDDDARGRRSNGDDAKNDAEAAMTTHWRHQMHNATRRKRIKHADMTTVSHQHLNRCIHKRRDLSVYS